MRKFELTIPVEGASLLRYPEGNLYQGFGENVELYLKAVNMRGHNGVDIALPCGTPILCPCDGVVVSVNNNPAGYGKSIEIFHGEFDEEVNEFGQTLYKKYYSTIYAHCQEIFVIEGQEVKQRQVIATLGNTGFVISGNTPYWGDAPAGKGCHLHFGVRGYVKGNFSGRIYTFHGEIYTITGFDNGVGGYIDPMLFFKPEELMKGAPAPKEFSHQFARDIVFSETSDEVKALQNALKIDGAFPKEVKDTGYYGKITQQAVKDFQKKYKVAPSWELWLVNGRRVGAKTRKKLNELFNK